MNKPFVTIGLTGPTGAGKGEVARFLRENGFFHVDTDALSREAVLPGSDCLKALAEAFSADILLPDGSLDRAALAARAFADPAQTRRLNAIVHPVVIALSERDLKAAREAGYPAAVIDAPLLFESGMDKICDFTVAVIARREIRLERILYRDGITIDQALQRIRSQPDDDYYTSRCPIVIPNNGTPEQLREQCVRILDAVREQAGDL